MDHNVESIRNYIDEDILRQYYCSDLTLQSEHIWQTKMIRTELDSQEYFMDDIDPQSPMVADKMARIKREMRGIVNMMPD